MSISDIFKAIVICLIISFVMWFGWQWYKLPPSTQNTIFLIILTAGGVIVIFVIGNIIVSVILSHREKTFSDRIDRILTYQENALEINAKENIALIRDNRRKKLKLEDGDDIVYNG